MQGILNKKKTQLNQSNKDSLYEVLEDYPIKGRVIESVSALKDDDPFIILLLVLASIEASQHSTTQKVLTNCLNKMDILEHSVEHHNKLILELTTSYGKLEYLINSKYKNGNYKSANETYKRIQRSLDSVIPNYRVDRLYKLMSFSFIFQMTILMIVAFHFIFKGF